MDHQQRIAENGYSIIESVFDQSEIEGLISEIQIGLSRAINGNIKSSRGETYAARNLAELSPRLVDLWCKPALSQVLNETLGQNFGLVRILFFDKHPNRTWSLPWHKDMTIAVKDNSLNSEHFAKPTIKSGIDHVEASTELLEQMLTLRIHLDQVTRDNGPLQVAVGSHCHRKVGVQQNQVDTILVGAGDVLAMRPLLSHASGSSTPGTTMHRRILHLEFSGCRELADGFEWNLFHELAPSDS